MSAAHTEGLLTVSMDEPNLSAYLVGEDRRAMARVINAGLRGNYGADARRLAACWNALDGLPTALLEKHGATRSGIYRGTAEINDQLAAARALLSELIAIEGPQPGTAAWAEKVRAFLKGGAA